MELEHRFTVPAPVTETWAAFNDLERIAPCFPGATLTSTEGDEFAGSVKVRLGPISLLYNGTGRFVERDDDARRAVIEAKGKDKRGNGTATATVRAQLAPDGEQTSVEVVTDLAITGKPAQFGRGVIQDVSDKLLGQFVACLEQNLGTTGASASAQSTDAPAAAESTAAGTPASAAAASTGSAEGAASTGSAASSGAAESAASTESAAESSASTGSAETTADRAGQSSGQTQRSAASSDAELNLLTTVGPALAKRYAVPAIGVLLLLLLLRKLLRH